MKQSRWFHLDGSHSNNGAAVIVQFLQGAFSISVRSTLMHGLNDAIIARAFETIYESKWVRKLAVKWKFQECKENVLPKGTLYIYIVYI